MLANKQHHQTVGLSLDQAHLAQINQLMSDINKAAAATTSGGETSSNVDEISTTATTNAQSNSSTEQQQQQQHLIDMLGTSPLVFQTNSTTSSSGNFQPQI